MDLAFPSTFECLQMCEVTEEHTQGRGGGSSRGSERVVGTYMCVDTCMWKGAGQPQAASRNNKGCRVLTFNCVVKESSNLKEEYAFCNFKKFVRLQTEFSKHPITINVIVGSK